jgi:hypothetical protein
VSERFADCSECESLRKLLPYLKAIAQRDNGGERIEVPLKKLFEDPLVADAWMLEMTTHEADGKLNYAARQRYYFREHPNVDRNSPNFVYISTFDGKTKNGLLWKDSNVIYADRAPQTVVADEVLPILKDLNDSNWEQSFCRILAAIHANHAMDPVLKVNLFQQTLDTAIRGSFSMEKAFGPHLEWIKEARIDVFANWLDPTDATVANIRNKAAAKLQRFPDVNAAIKAAQQDMKTDHQLSDSRWVGWLHRNRDGRWACLGSSDPHITGSLFVVCRQPTGEKLVLNAIGRWDHNAAIIDATAQPALAEGRPVYLKVP